MACMKYHRLFYCNCFSQSLTDSCQVPSGNELVKLDFVVVGFLWFFFLVMFKTKRPDASSGDISADEYFCLAYEYIQWINTVNMKSDTCRYMWMVVIWSVMPGGKISFSPGSVLNKYFRDEGLELFLHVC